MIENIISVFPFFLVLIIYQNIILSLSLIAMAFVMIFFSLKGQGNYTIPAPFGKKPFEFSEGFRKTFLLILIPYFLTFMSILYANFNLGFFSLLVMTLICFSFYSPPEELYFVWNFNLSSKSFLFEKLKIGMKYLTFLNLPILLVLLFFFSSEYLILVITFLICYVYLILFILSKYAAYPNEINLPQGVIIAIGIMLPPVLIFLIPILFVKAKNQLKDLLV
jgi:hypothetical protein